MSSAYREVESLIWQMRRQALTYDGKVEELQITLPVRLWQAVIASMPPAEWQHVTVPHGIGRNSMVICGVTVYEAEPDRSFR
jgi:hypothetical protein